MKFTWLLNGTTEAHHLAAAYLTVWLIQGGYAAWIAWQWFHTKRPAKQKSIPSL
jgi:hypothetical protein